jgi:hypothetical protein
MTIKEQERIKNKIRKVKAFLAADKKRTGGSYDDSRGLRYIPPQLYIALDDFTGGLRYFNWFNKNFPNDICYPDFLFEWTLVLFKTGRPKEAEKKAFKTFCSYPLYFDLFFGKKLDNLEKREGLIDKTPDITVNRILYSNKQDVLTDFSTWLTEFIATEKFKQLSNKYLDIQHQLKTEKVTETRHLLIQQEGQLIKEL